jgi:galactokinase
VISENRRVKQAARAMESRGLDALGKIMEQGYKSCRDDYENSIPELDRLHDLATVLPGVYGVRICGAGWGGCLLALVQKKRAAQFQEGILTKYAEQSGRQAKCWVVEPSNGAGPLR